MNGHDTASSFGIVGDATPPWANTAIGRAHYKLAMPLTRHKPVFYNGTRCTRSAWRRSAGARSEKKVDRPSATRRARHRHRLLMGPPQGAIGMCRSRSCVTSSRHRAGTQSREGRCVCVIDPHPRAVAAGLRSCRLAGKPSSEHGVEEEETRRRSKQLIETRRGEPYPSRTRAC